MSESFVDLSYRGLALGKRIKLTQVRKAAGFLELPTPMPVGTSIGITTDEGVLIEAQVAEVREQVTGVERVAGMLVRPKLDADAARDWWSARADVPEPKVERPAPAADTEGKVTVVSRRHEVPVPELVDDGRSTSVVEAIREAPELVADVPLVRDTQPTIPAQIQTIAGMPSPVRGPSPDAPVLVDDGKRTMMMDAVDLAALGLDPSTGASGQFAAVKPEDYADGDDNGGGDSGPTAADSGPVGKPEGKTKKKRKRR